MRNKPMSFLERLLLLKHVWIFTVAKFKKRLKPPVITGCGKTVLIIYSEVIGFYFHLVTRQSHFFCGMCPLGKPSPFDS